MNGISFFLLFFPFFSFAALLDEGNAYYLKGEKATSFEEREQAFNQALRFYFQALEETPSPFLYQMLGDTFYQLEEYAWAILYYEKHLKKEPDNVVVRQRLHQIQEKKGLPLSLTKNHDLVLFWMVLLVCFTLCSWWIWKEVSLKNFLVLLLLFIGFCFFLLFKNIYSSPSAILVQASGLYTAPDISSPLFLDSGLIAGSSVDLLEEEKEGEWLFVRSLDRKTGYLPFSSLRSID